MHDREIHTATPRCSFRAIALYNSYYADAVRDSVPAGLNRRLRRGRRPPASTISDLDAAGGHRDRFRPWILHGTH